MITLRVQLLLFSGLILITLVPLTHHQFSVGSDPEFLGFHKGTFSLTNETLTIASEAIMDAVFNITLYVMCNKSTEKLDVIINRDVNELLENESFSSQFVSGEFEFKLKSDKFSQGEYWYNLTIVSGGAYIGQPDHVLSITIIGIAFLAIVIGRKKKKKRMQRWYGSND